MSSRITNRVYFGRLDHSCSPTAGETPAGYAMFNPTIDSKLRGCDLVRLTFDDVVGGGGVRN
jgi:hypothetical protein